MRVFVAHASEDKETAARPVSEALRILGHDVWFDEFSLVLGDSLSAEIDRGLSECDFGVVILSPYFFAKNWPQRELAGLVARETSRPQSRKLILPVWHDISADQVRGFSPTLADRVAASTSEGVDAVVRKIDIAMTPPPAAGGPYGRQTPAAKPPTSAQQILSRIVPEGPDLPSEGLSPRAIEFVHEFVQEWEEKGRLNLLADVEKMSPERRRVLFNEEKYVYLFPSHGMHKVWFEVIDSSYRTIGTILAPGRERDLDYNKALEFFLIEMGLDPEGDMFKVTVVPVINADNMFWVTVP